MTKDRVNGIVRAITPAVIAFLAAKGLIIDGATAEIITSSVVAIAFAAWSVWSNRPSRKPIGG